MGADTPITEFELSGFPSVKYGVKLPINAPSVIPKLTNSPLVFVLAQVRFSPISKIEDYLQDIQELVRQQGFPNLNKRKIQFQQFAAPGSVESKELAQWECINPEKTASLIFDEGSACLQTTQYDTFAPFSELLRNALEALNQVARPTLTQRIGFRCVNVVVPDEGRSFDHYLRRELLGATLEPIGSRLQFLTEALLQTSDSTQLVIRYHEAQKGVAFPFDLLGPLLLRFRRELVMQKPFSILDLDHFKGAAADFSVESVLNDLTTLHRGLDDAFIKIATQEGVESWK